MEAFDELVEKRITAVMEQGDFDRLAGQGKPLVLDDDRAVPEELRLAYRILKNAGYVPPEVELRSAIAKLERLVVVSMERRGTM